MSHQQSSSLLWINKDATNVHRKKHVAEVNAHVQKSGSKKRTSKKAVARRKAVTPNSPNIKDENPSLPIDQVLSSPHADGKEPGRAVSVRQASLDVVETISLGERSRRSSKSSTPKPTSIIFSSYLEDGAIEASDTNADEDEEADLDLELARLTDQLQLSLPTTFDASNPLPGFPVDLPDYDRMLIHTHLTYMPHMYYGLSNRAPYCPIRNASVVNMLRAKVGFLWVLISLEMFLETARKSSGRKAVILQRKNHAYQLMSKAFKEQSRSNDENLLLGSTAAAITEMFCGDPAKALTHLNGIEAFIMARGGMKYVKQMGLTISMPIFAVSAYRTLLQDNLTTVGSFERARQSFVSNMKALLSWNNEVASTLVSGTHPAQQHAQHDEGFDGNFDLTDTIQELQEARMRAFLYNPLLSKFFAVEYDSSKPGEKVDHFVLLFNTNRAIADHGSHFKQAISFVEDLANDAEIGGSTRGPDSSIKLSGVLRLLTNRQVRMFSNEPGKGVVRAWDALDALEVMKLLPLNMQKSVQHTLHALLVGHVASAMTESDLVAIDAALVSEWYLRHPQMNPAPG